MKTHLVLSLVLFSFFASSCFQEEDSRSPTNGMVSETGEDISFPTSLDDEAFSVDDQFIHTVSTAQTDSYVLFEETLTKILKQENTPKIYGALPVTDMEHTAINQTAPNELRIVGFNKNGEFEAFLFGLYPKKTVVKVVRRPLSKEVTILQIEYNKNEQLMTIKSTQDFGIEGSPTQKDIFDLMQIYTDFYIQLAIFTL